MLLLIRAIDVSHIHAIRCKVSPDLQYDISPVHVCSMVNASSD